MVTKAPHFALSRERALEIIRRYDGYALTAVRIRDKLAEEVAAADAGGRPINKARFLAITRWFGITREDRSHEKAEH